MTERTVHVIIHGRVQGVGFRAWVHHHAELNGLRGWVRNRPDGTVEALFSGSDFEVEAMVKACRQGPRGSHVAALDLRPGTDQPESPGFEVRPTA
jgi:acylphosphatase